MTGRPNVVHGRLLCIKGRRVHRRCEIALPGGRRVVRPIDEVRLVPQPPAGALGPTP